MHVFDRNYELLVRGVCPEDARRRLADHRTRRWWSPSLVRVRDDGRLEMRVHPKAPRLSATLVDDPAGVRIVGRLRWLHHFADVTSAGAAALFLCAMAVSDPHHLIFAGIAAWFLLCFTILVLTWKAAYEQEEARIGAKLQSTLAGPV